MRNDGTGHVDAAFEPAFPTDVTARQYRGVTVDDDEFWMQDTEGEVENALHLQIQPLELLGAWKTEFGGPGGRGVDMALGRGGMQNLLQQ